MKRKILFAAVRNGNHIQNLIVFYRDRKGLGVVYLSSEHPEDSKKVAEDLEAYWERTKTNDWWKKSEDEGNYSRHKCRDCVEELRRIGIALSEKLQEELKAREAARYL